MVIYWHSESLITDYPYYGTRRVREPMTDGSSNMPSKRLKKNSSYHHRRKGLFYSNVKEELMKG
jgi:hypothetical protein